MSWYDYIPIAGSITRLARGEGGGAALRSAADSLGGPIVGTIAHGEGDAVQQHEQGYDNAINQLNALSDKQRAFQMEGLNKAEGYYQPAQQMIQSIYGPPGSMRK